MKIKNFIKSLFQKKVNKHTLYVGLNDKDTKKQEIETEQAKKIIIQEFANNNIEGATFLGAEGLYAHFNGETVKENSFKIEILFSNNTDIRNAIDGIKQKLNQESIAVVNEKITSSLI